MSTIDDAIRIVSDLYTGRKILGYYTHNDDVYFKVSTFDLKDGDIGDNIAIPVVNLKNGKITENNHGAVFGGIPALYVALVGIGLKEEAENFINSYVKLEES